MRDFLNKPYDLLESKKFRYLVVFGGALFGFLFLWIFEPYGLYNLTINKKFLTITLHIVVALILTFIQFFLIQNYIISV